MCALDEWKVDELAALVRRAANFAELSDEVFTSVLDLLAGPLPVATSSPSCGRASCGTASAASCAAAPARNGSPSPAAAPSPTGACSACSCPTAPGSASSTRRWSTRAAPGETFLLGASTWRIEDITHERVDRHARAGLAGQDAVLARRRARPAARARPGGRRVRARAAGAGATGAAERLQRRLRARRAAPPRNLVQYLDEQAEATGVVPDDRTIVVERFRDEIGDWRVCVLSPFGAQVHAPWAMALQARLAERWGIDVELMWSDDGIVLRLPEAVDELPVDELLIDPDEIDETRRSSQLPNTAMFASRFRECAARALLLPRRRPDRRTPLWQQRQKAADLLTGRGAAPDFPILLETTRECLNDVFDLPGAARGARPTCGLARSGWSRSTHRGPRRSRSRCFRRGSPSTCTRATRRWPSGGPPPSRSTATCCATCSAPRSCASCSTRSCWPTSSSSCSTSSTGAEPATPTSSTTCCALLGPLHGRRARRRAPPATRRRGSTARSLRRAPGHRGDRRRRGALSPPPKTRRGCATRSAWRLPVGLPGRVHRPGRRSAARPGRPLSPARTAVPHRAGRASTSASAPQRVLPALERSSATAASCAASSGPTGVEREWCDDDVLRQLRRRSLAALRKEVEPVDARRAGPLPARVAGRRRPNRRGVDALVEVIGVLQGAAIPASVLETDVLPARVAELPRRPISTRCARRARWSGSGAGGLGATDGRVRLVFRDQAPMLVPAAGRRIDALAHARRRCSPSSTERGASFWPELVAAVAAAGLPYDEPTVLAALWDLVWAGTSPTTRWRPVRAMVAGAAGAAAPSPSRRSRPRPGRLARARAAGGGGPLVAGRAACSSPAPTPTEVAHAQAMQLLERYGVLTREAALAEGIEGGFAGVYPVLKALEERGEVRRGYFVAGLGAAQFALPGAVDRLRSFRDPRRGRRRPDGRGAGRHRSGPAVRRRAAVARARRGRPARAPRGRARRAGRRRARPPTSSGAGTASSPSACGGWAPALRELVDRRSVPIARDPQGRRRAGPRRAASGPSPTSCGPRGSSRAIEGLVYQAAGR